MTTPIKEGTHWRHRIIVTGVWLSGTFDTKGAAQSDYFDTGSNAL